MEVYVATVTQHSTNAAFTAPPAISPSGTLTFRLKPHSYGTNLVTIVMKDNGGTAHGGVDAFTNSFSLAIVQTNHSPSIGKIASQTMLENGTNATVSVDVWDYDQNSSNFVLTATSLNTNLETISVSTNVSFPSLTNAIFTLTMTPGSNQFGVATNQLVATEAGLSTTNTFKLAITHVNQAPSFAFNTNVVISNMFASEEETGAVTNAGFLTQMSAGPANESSQTWKFTVTTEGNQPANAGFKVLPAIAGNGTLTFHPKAHSYGTNLVTVVMKDNGGAAHGGIDACTNSFLLAIVQTNHAPNIASVANCTAWENATNVTASVSVWDYDQTSSNFVLTASSSNTNLETVSVSTNVSLPTATNAVFTLNMTLATNQFGSVTNQLVASEGALSTTNTFVLTIKHVNQPPSFAFNTNVLAVAENGGTTNIPGFLANLSPGPANETGQTWTFALTTSTNNATNAVFTQLAAATNGTLTLAASSNSFGTNTVTVVMTDNGGTANGGVAACTNTFQVQVAQVWYPPQLPASPTRRSWKTAQPI